MNGHGNILIIDDQKSDAAEFERVLRAEGFEVETAATAEAGLARARRNGFDVVLTGLHLSGPDEGRKEGVPAGDPPLASYVSDLLARVMRNEVEDAHARLIAATERELYSQAIQLASGDQSKVAKWLGVFLPTIREKLLRYGLHPRKKANPSAQPGPTSRTPALEAS